VRWVLVLSIAIISMQGWGQSDPQDRFALTTRQVVRTLSDNGIVVSDDQVCLLAKIVATERDPVLDIQKVEPLGDLWFGNSTGTQSWFKVACHEPGACLPFYAVVSWPAKSIACSNDTFEGSPVVRKTALKPIVAIRMRAGTHATLVMDDDRLHIQIAVISLESGVAGNRIRVASPDHKQVYLAEVVSAHLLKRSF
jgi:hypothetical protein